MYSKFFLLLLILTIFSTLKAEDATLEEGLMSLPETLKDFELIKTLAILFVSKKLNTPNHSNRNKIANYIVTIKNLEQDRYQKKRNLSDRYNELRTAVGDLDEIVDNLESNITSKTSSLRISVSSLDEKPGSVPINERGFYLKRIHEGFSEIREQQEEKPERIRKIRRKRRRKKRKLMKKGINKEKEKLVNEIKKLQNELKNKNKNVILGKRNF